ncbi:hypothetical protein [Clostridium sporogenes]|uniref:hypothetical protein n=1 Tax=Clostridium sporogenes TaxID=1509 RepID=UPI003DA386EE
MNEIFNWEDINKLSCAVTIGLPIVTVVTTLKFNKFKRWIEYKRIKNNVSKKHSGVLIVSVGKNDIENQVKLWLKERKGYKSIPDERILKVEKIGDINPKNLDNIIKDLENKKFKLQQKGINNLHLFVAAPVVIGEIVGAKLANNFNVFVYHHDFHSKNKYELWGKLQR